MQAITEETCWGNSKVQVQILAANWAERGFQRGVCTTQAVGVGTGQKWVALTYLSSKGTPLCKALPFWNWQHLLLEKILVENGSTKILVYQSKSWRNLCLSVGQGVTQPTGVFKEWLQSTRSDFSLHCACPTWIKVVPPPDTSSGYQTRNLPITGSSNPQLDHYNLA